ncbi:MAG: trimeric intracellular cation channel family protein [Pseudomonadota bacterium]
MPPAIQEWVYYFGFGAVAVSAATGVLEAGRKPIDLFGMVVVALAAALGGGTIRDLLLDRAVFWVADVTYLYTAFLAGVATFALVRLVRLPPDLFLIPDAVGLALFTILGTEIALAFGTPWFTATLLGVITGVFGGVLRDILCNEVPLVFGGELYATAAWTGAVLLVGLNGLGLEGQLAAWAAFCTILALRLGALRWHIGLPVFTARK